MGVSIKSAIFASRNKNNDNMKKTSVTIETTDDRMVESLRNLADFIEENNDMDFDDMKCLGKDDYSAWIDDLGEVDDNREEWTYFRPECYYDDGCNPDDFVIIDEYGDEIK